MSFTMGLYVMPKHKNCSPVEVYTVEGYFSYLRTTNKRIPFDEWYKKKSGYSNYSDKELQTIFTKEMLDFYEPHYRALYWPFDIFKTNPRYRIAEDMTFAELNDAYHIRDWFITNSDEYSGCYMVSKEVLESLLEVCKKVSDNPDIASALLPISEDDGTYDKDYWRGVKDALDFVPRILSKVNFDTHMVHFDFD